MTWTGLKPIAPLKNPPRFIREYTKGMRILLIEDDTQTIGFLKSGLETECFSVDQAFDGEAGLYLAKTNDYDLIITDYFLPKKNGLEVCEGIRAKGKKIPIIVLSVHSAVPNKVALLNAGADDYLTKPFSFEELLARVKALLRRPLETQSDVLELANLRLDSGRHQFRMGNLEIALTRKEFQLLEFLLRNKGQVVSRTMILEHVWDIHGDIFSNSIETHVSNLRRKIDKRRNQKLIKTISGIGYKLG